MQLRLALPGAILAFAVPASAQDGGTRAVNLIDPDQRPAVEKLQHDFAAPADPARFTTTTRAVATLVRNQHSIASVRGFSVVQDEPTSVAGGGTGPTPTDLFMASLGTCQNVVFVRFAALAQIPIEALETTAVGTWDLRGLFRIGDTEPGYKEITIETRVTTSAPPEKVAEAVRRTQRGCPIYATLRRETALSVRLIVNGQSVPL
jgi:uncharacterized OsmC-like protein